MTLYDPANLLQQIATALKQVALDPLGTTLNRFDYPHGAPPLPAGMVVTPEIDYRAAMAKGVFPLLYEIHLIGGVSAGHEQQKQLWDYLNPAGAKSIVALVDANPSLGIVGADSAPRVDAHVMRARRLTLDEMPPFETWVFGTALEVAVVVTNR